MARIECLVCGGGLRDGHWGLGIRDGGLVDRVDRDGLGRERLLGRCGRQVVSLDRAALGGAALDRAASSAGSLGLSLSHVFLCLLCVVAGDIFQAFGGTASVVSSEFTDLSSLRGSNILSVGEVSIDEVLVLDVDEGSEEEGGVADQSEAPKWEPLDEPVGYEGCDESLSSY